MTAENKSGKGNSGGQWQGRRKDRDDTPSFIRNVNASAGMMNPNRRTEHGIPVLEVPASIRLWHKVRWPLLVSVVLAVLVSVGWFTHGVMVSKNVERRIAEAATQEEAAQVSLLVESNRVLSDLAANHPTRMNAQVAYAWSSVLLAYTFGPADSYLKEADSALAFIQSDSTAVGYAARVGKLALLQKWAEAEKLEKEALARHPDEPRIHLVNAWIQFGIKGPDAAIASLQKTRKRFPDYLPPLYTLISLGSQNRDTVLMANASTELLARSTGNMYGSLISILVKLPDWNGEELVGDELKNVEDFAASLEEKLEGSPDQIRNLGHFVKARVDLIAGRASLAAKGFKALIKVDTNLNVLPWYGLAVRVVQGPAAAIDAIEDAGENPSFEILDLRVRCHLDQYHLLQAREVLAQIQAAGYEGVDEHYWILAVREGNLEEARKWMPRRIDGRLRFKALEMYELLSRTGDQDGINALREAMVNDAAICADAIAAFHGSNVRKAFDALSSKDMCITAFALRMMQDHFSPDVLNTMAQRITPLAAGELRLEVDRALGIWKTEGQLRASEVLKKVSASKPGGVLLISALGQAYYKIGLYNEALATAELVEHPETQALKIAVYDARKETAKRDELIATTASNAQMIAHPAILYWVLNKKLDDADYAAVIEQAEQAMDTAGIWTADLADVKARALNAIGSRGDADRFLSSMARQIIPLVGLDQSWAVQKRLIRLNLRRGGAFLFKAVSVTLELYNDKVKDAEIAYSYGVGFLRQGNERGSLRFFEEAIALDPSFVPAYEILKTQTTISPEQLALLEKIRPGTVLR